MNYKYNIENYMYNKKGNLATFITLFIIILLSAIIYIGYQKYQERFFINFYDDSSMDHFLEIPGYCERLTDANKELIGECDLKIGTSFEQAKNVDLFINLT